MCSVSVSKCCNDGCVLYECVVVVVGLGLGVGGVGVGVDDGSLRRFCEVSENGYVISMVAPT